ncbi:molybdopterin-dependent oxidoreductase [Streptomyces formicae]|uniref:Anaerobic dimethyl sulfoxide reductase chain A n=1 Tax=Streptomyces formicae TaxID=1616117 RepID=A0A291QNJ7_9ACTN|nr:molybdopterin-dependent oxidoreductase [Streptomyces formicae]ATL33114.1 Anaerobic dimethyl sulfoxide reductase chain A [Streptomyces formicae]
MIEERRSFCTLCKSRCGAIYTVTDGRITDVRPDPEHPTGAAMCPKGKSAPEIAHSTRRLTTPLRRTNPKSHPDPGWRPISWDEALDEIAERMREIAAESGPEAVAFAVATPSGTMVSDATEWIERFIRLFGSPNTVYSAEICNWHKDFAHAFTFGTPLPPPDYAHADLALLWGFNPAKTWLSQSAAVSAAQARGMRLAVVDPRRSTSALRADHWLRVRPGTDAALALGLAHLLIENGSYDEEFVRTWTNGPLLVRRDNGRFLRADELAAETQGFVVWDEADDGPRAYDTHAAARSPERFALRGAHRVRTLRGSVLCEPAFERYARACAEWPAERVAHTTWIPEPEIRALAEEIGAARSVTYYGWTGVGQSANAAQTERALATLYALTGSYDTEGGNHLVPPPPYNPATWAGQLAPEQRAKALGIDKHPLGPPASGYVNAGDLCRAIETQEPYAVRALIGFGSNLVVAQPDSDRVARALRSLEFQVHLDLFANPTSTTADIVLPVNSAYEHEALRFGFEIDHRAQEHTQLRPRLTEPVGTSRSDTEVVFDLACRLGMGEEFFGGDVEAAWNWQLEPLGLTVGELRGRPGGVRVPRPRALRKYARRTGEPAAPGGEAVAGFGTPTRRVELYSERLWEHGHPAVPEHRSPVEPDAAFPLVLTCAKHGHFVHSQHRSLTTLRRRSPDPCVDMSPEAAAARGISEGQWVELSTRLGGIRLRARFDGSLHPSVVVSEYGWWQDAPDLALPGADPVSGEGSNLNRLIGYEGSDPLSGSVPLRASVCEIRPLPSDGTWSGTRPFTVTAVGAEGSGVRTLRLEPADGGPLPDYRPGQHVTVHAEDASGAARHPSLGRSYSLTGPATAPARTSYDLAVRHVPDGSFSTYVHEELRAGSRLHLSAPGGTFRIPSDTATPVVLLAGGIGVTPFMSYLETLAASGGTVPEVVLHHGNTNSADHPFRTRLHELRGRVRALRIIDHYTAPGADDVLGRDHERRGFITADDIDPELIARRARFYLCGPLPMLDALTEGLRARGVPRFEIFSERFRSAPREVDVPDDAEFAVRFARSGRSVTWRTTDGSLLELGERAGVSLPSGCRVGQCESCACTVLTGRATSLVRVPDDLPEETVLTCQSVPASDLVLDA